MLTQIRARASGWLAWVIVILITIPFALWGIQSYFENSPESPVATVNGEEISVYAFQNELSRQRRAMLQNGNADPASLDSIDMRTRALESMIDERLLNQYVLDNRYQVSDRELRQRIESNPSFVEEGKFDPNLYRNILRSNGLTAQFYETTERQNAAIGQLSAAVVGTAFVDKAEIDRLLALQAQTRRADYALLPAQRFAADIAIEDADIEQQYEDNLAAYENPARIKVDYIELSVDGLAATIEPTADEVEDLYRQTIERHKQPETRKASHILFSVEADDAAAEPAADEDGDGDVADAAGDAALAQAEAVLAQALAGDDFAELAKLHSGDTGSKEKGGDLGVVARGQMVKPFEDAVFDMTEGEIRGPIKTRFGYHIIKLTELQGERQKPLTEVRVEVIAEAKKNQAENLFAEMGESFANLVFEFPDSLAVAAEELGLEVKQTDWFTAAGAADEADDASGLVSEDKIRQAAFSEEVVDDDVNSAAIELSLDHLAAIRKADYEAAHPQPYTQVRDAIEQDLVAQESRRQTEKLGDQLSAELVGGALAWDDFLAQQKLEAATLDPQRGQASADLTALEAAVFSHAHPAAGAVVYGGVLLDNGDYAIYALKEVLAGDGDSVDEDQRSSLRAQLLARDGEDFFKQFLTSLREQAKLSVDQGQLQNPTASRQ